MLRRELSRDRSHTVLIWSQPVYQEAPVITYPSKRDQKKKKIKFTHLTFKTRYKSSLIHQALHITKRDSTFGLGSINSTTLELGF